MTEKKKIKLQVNYHKWNRKQAKTKQAMYKNRRMTFFYIYFALFKEIVLSLVRMRQTLIFEQDVAKSKDAKRVREPCKNRLHRAWQSSILH